MWCRAWFSSLVEDLGGGDAGVAGQPGDGEDLRGPRDAQVAGSQRRLES
jgi:hypothetical protein